MSGSLIAPDVVSVVFGTIGAGAASAVWENSRAASASVTLGGTFGGATVVIEGSDVSGGPYSIVTGIGGAASYTAAGVAQIELLPRFWRVRAVGGTGTAVTATATVSFIHSDPATARLAREAAFAASEAAAAAEIAADAAAADAVRRPTLADLQAVTTSPTGTLGEVFAGGADNGSYRWDGAAWVLVSTATIPSLDTRTTGLETFARVFPTSGGYALAVADPNGVSLFRIVNGNLWQFPNAALDFSSDTPTFKRRDGLAEISLPSTGPVVGGFRFGVDGTDAVISAPGGAEILRASVGPGGAEASFANLVASGSAEIVGLDFRGVTTTSSTFLLPTVTPDGIIRGGISRSGVLGSGGSGGGSSTAFDAEDYQRLDALNLARAEEIRRRRMTGYAAPLPGINHELITGQSLSAGVLSKPILTASHRTGLYMLGGAVNSLTDADTVWSPVGGSATLTPLAGWAENVSPNRGETPNEAAADYFRRAWLRERGLVSDDTTRHLLTSAGVGGKSIATLQKGATANWYGKLTSAVTQAKAEALALSQIYRLLSIDLIHGESDARGNDGGLNSLSFYKPAIEQYYRDIVADHKPVGQELNPVMFLSQVGEFYNRDSGDMGVAMAQIALADENPHMVLVGPHYHVTNIPSDGHLDANGSRWFGQLMGKVKETVLLRGEGWRPCSPLYAVHRADEVLVGCHVPVPPLVFDTPWDGYTPATLVNNGFELLVNGTAVTIASVQFVGRTLIKITPAAPVFGVVKIRYAGQVNGGLGGVRDSDAAVASQIYVSGVAGQAAEADIPALNDKPYPLQNWLTAFTITSSAA